MKALEITKPGVAVVKDVPVPEPAPGEVLIKVDTCGICGTDVHILHGEFLGTYPIIPGHEGSGTVAAPGDGAEGFVPGQAVTFEPNISCGQCHFCRINEQHYCINRQAVGVTRPGAFAEFVTCPAELTFPVGDMPLGVAAFTEPLSCVLHGVEKLNVKSGDGALVIGAGPIGNLIMQALLARGAGSVAMADVVDGRLEAARKMGAAQTYNTASGFDAVKSGAGVGYDVVVEAAGVPELFAECIELARSGGQILWFSVSPKGKAAAFEPFELYRKGLSVHTAFTSLRNTIGALRLLESGRVRVKDLVSHRLPLEEFTRGVDLLADPKDAMKIQIGFE